MNPQYRALCKNWRLSIEISKSPHDEPSLTFPHSFKKSFWKTFYLIVLKRAHPFLFPPLCGIIAFKAIQFQESLRFEAKWKSKLCASFTFFISVSSSPFSFIELSSECNRWAKGQILRPSICNEHKTRFYSRFYAVIIKLQSYWRLFWDVSHLGSKVRAISKHTLSNGGIYSTSLILVRTNKPENHTALSKLGGKHR